MKKIFLIGCFGMIAIAVLLTVVGVIFMDNPTETTKTATIESKTEKVSKEDKIEKKEEVEINKDNSSNETPSEKKEEINTSVFAYAKKVDVTNAIDINDHITVFVHMDESLKQGLAAQHVLNQSYDFLQQDDIKAAKTVTIAVKQGDLKTFQFTVDKNKFKTDDNISISELVLASSKVEHMSPEVKEAAEAFGWKINK